MHAVLTNQPASHSLGALEGNNRIVCGPRPQMVPGGGLGDYGILDSDPDFALIRDNANKMAACGAAAPLLDHTKPTPHQSCTSASGVAWPPLQEQMQM